MKFLTRVRLPFIVMALVMMLSGSAWAAYNIDPIVRLDSTGKNLDVTLTYQKDGVNDPVYGVLSTVAREAMGEKMTVWLRLGYPDGSSVEKLSQSPIAINGDNIKATFIFDEALENGEYRFVDFYTEANAETASWSEEQWATWFATLQTGMTWEELNALDANYSNLEANHYLIVNGGQPVLIERETSGNEPPTNEPPTVPDNTTVTIDLNPDGKIVGISVKTADGSPIPSNVLFKIWLLAQNVQGQSIGVKATSDDVGPFVAESGSGGVLNIDVDNLKNPDGSKASITAGSYVIKFADGEGKYVGTTEAIALKGTGTTTTPPNDNGGGGCNAGFGMTALLLGGCGLVTRKSRKV